MAKKKIVRRARRRTSDELIADLEARIQALKAKVREGRKFSPAAVAAERERLELSAADYAELVGVSHLTIYSWEKGRSAPRKAQLEAWLAVKGIPKNRAWEELGIEGDFSPEAVAADRERLELSAADYAELVGVSALTIYNWEHGRSKPQNAQLEAWADVQGIPKSEAWEQLGIEGDFSPEAIATDRARLELSAADYAKLVGVSALTIYNWEKGKTQPHAKKLEQWLSIKGMGKRKAWSTLGF